MIARLGKYNTIRRKWARFFCDTTLYKSVTASEYHFQGWQWSVWFSFGFKLSWNFDVGSVRVYMRNTPTEPLPKRSYLLADSLGVEGLTFCKMPNRKKSCHCFQVPRLGVIQLSSESHPLPPNLINYPWLWSEIMGTKLSVEVLVESVIGQISKHPLQKETICTKL